jgi:hypothetical protein
MNAVVATGYVEPNTFFASFPRKRESMGATERFPSMDSRLRGSDGLVSSAGRN